MFRFQFQRFYNQPGADGGATGTGTPAPAAPAAAPSAPAAPAAPTGGGAPASTATGQPAPRMGDDRSDWIPPHRYNEVNARATRADTLARENEILQSRLRVALGVEEGPDPQEERVKAAILRMFPQISSVEELQRKFDDMAGNVYGGRASEAVRTATANFATLLGKKPEELDPEVSQWLALNLDGFIKQDQTGARFQRFQNNDPTLFSEFNDRMRRLFVDPARTIANTAAATTVATNQALPRQGPAGPAGGSGEPPKKLRGKELREAARQHMLGQTPHS